MNHAQTITKPEIDRNLTKHKDMLVFLKRSCEDSPDIDAFTL